MKRKTIIVVFVIIAVIGVIGYNYLYQDHREIDAEVVVAALSSESIVEIFKHNAANDLLNATVSVKGIISEVDGRTITLDDKVTCSFTNQILGFKVGDTLTIKGRCIGYDDLFEIVKLDQCSYLNKNG
ncbi:MAG: hypothetical protein DWP94_04100 [Flavobacterium sp.]|nr:MAG: hypothetical protein DWP94_04100 [Flavobacterium sp.]